MGLLNFLPREEQYFDLFLQMTVYISEAARELKEMLADKDHNYREYSQRIKGLEHACDELTHNIATRLNKSFITPFDREDIYTMSSALDDIVDLIDDAARAIIIFDVHETTGYARQFADVIERMAGQLQEIVSILRKTQKYYAAPGGDPSPGERRRRYLPRRDSRAVSRRARPSHGAEVERDLRETGSRRRSL